MLTCFISLCTTSCAMYDGLWNAKIWAKCQWRIQYFVGGSLQTMITLEMKTILVPKHSRCTDLQWLSVSVIVTNFLPCFDQVWDHHDLLNQPLIYLWLWQISYPVLTKSKTLMTCQINLCYICNCDKFLTLFWPSLRPSCPAKSTSVISVIVTNFLPCFDPV